MLLCKIKIDNSLESQKLLREKHRKADLENLKAKKEEFQIEIINQFQALQEEEDTDLDTWKNLIAHIIQESVLKTAGKERKECVFKMSDSTKQLMKRDGIGIQNMDSVETRKTRRVLSRAHTYTSGT